MTTVSSWWQHLQRYFHPHSQCYALDPFFVLNKTAADMLIWLAYIAISTGCLLLAVKLWGKLPFAWLLPWFFAFIILCGLTHQTEALTMFWTSWFAADLAARDACAIASIATAILFWRQMSRILGFIEAGAQMLELTRKAQALDDALEVYLGDLATSGCDASEGAATLKEIVADLRAPRRGTLGDAVK